MREVLSETDSKTIALIEAVKKAGIDLGPAYMLDPENDAPLAVMEDLALGALKEIKPQPRAPITEALE